MTENDRVITLNTETADVLVPRAMCPLTPFLSVSTRGRMITCVWLSGQALERYRAGQELLGFMLQRRFWLRRMAVQSEPWIISMHGKQ